MSAYDFGKDAATGITSLGNRIKKDLSEFEEKNLKAAWYLRTIFSFIALVFGAFMVEFGSQKLGGGNWLGGYFLMGIGFIAILWAAIFAWEISLGIITILALVFIYNKTKDFSQTENLIVAAWFSLAWLIYATRK